MNSYIHVARMLYGTPWALAPDVYHKVRSLLEFRIAGGRLSDTEIRERIGQGRTDRAPMALWDVETEALSPFDAAQPMGVQTAGRSVVGVIGIYGVIIPRASMLADTSGVMSSEQIAKNISAAAADPSITAIVLDVDSPGGNVAGARETASAIRAARKQKPVLAVANYQALSLAYWYASQATEVMASPSSLLGSIGVIYEHVDESEAMAKEGRKATVMTFGENKALGHPSQPLSDAARGEIQTLLDDAGQAFEADVSRGRGVRPETVHAKFGQGLMFSAEEARTRGLADSIGTLDAAVRKAAKMPREERTPKALAAEALTFNPVEPSEMDRAFAETRRWALDRLRGL